MLELSVLNDLRPLARGAHFIASFVVFALAYYGMRRFIYSESPTRTERLSLLCYCGGWALLSHYILDAVLRVP